MNAWPSRTRRQRFQRRIPARSCPECGSPNRTIHYRRGPICGDCGAPWPVFEA